jgi:hypothetical protein
MAGYVGRGLDHTADDLVSDHRRIDRTRPVAANGMEIGMASSAIEDLDRDVIRPQLLSIEVKRRERGAGRFRRVTDGSHCLMSLLRDVRGLECIEEFDTLTRSFTSWSYQSTEKIELEKQYTQHRAVLTK